MARGYSPRQQPGRGPKSLYPQLRARKNASSEQVAAHQRERLLGAMVEAVALHGYAATSVQELTALAGVSKKTLYDRFDDKLDCLLAAIEMTVDANMARVAVACRDGMRGSDGWRVGMLAAFDAFAAGLASEPKASWLVLVEAPSVSEAATQRIEHGEAALAKLLAGSLAQAKVTLSPVLVSGVVHGVSYVACNRLLESQPDALLGRGADLLDWLLCYDSPRAGELDKALRAAAPVTSSTVRGICAADRVGPRRAMLQAAARIAAEGGYAVLTGAQIAERAGLDRDAFAREFVSTEQCFLAALELLNAQALGRALRDSDGAESYPVAVCRAVERLLLEVASDLVFARVGFVEILAAGRAGVRHRSVLMRSFADVLMRCAPSSQRPSTLIAEAICGAIWGLVRRHVVSGSRRELPALVPYACYIALAPIIGAERALDVISSECLRWSGVRSLAANAEAV